MSSIFSLLKKIFYWSMMFHQILPSYLCIHKDIFPLLIIWYIIILINWYVLEIFLINPLMGGNHLFLHMLHLWCNSLFWSPIKSHTDSFYFLSLHSLQPLLQISGKLSTSLDNELDINLKLSINFSLYVIVLLL